MKIKRFLTSILAGIMLICGAVAFAGCKEKVNEMPSGVFFTLKEAYENHYITRNDLLNIAYYSFNATDNPEIDENFQPIEKGELDEETNQKIRICYAEEYNKKQSENLTHNDFAISSFYGMYNGGFCFYIHQKEDPNIDKPAMPIIYRNEIDGVVFFLKIENVMLWKEV